MATIDKRIYPNGNISHRVRTRLKGYPQQFATFASKTKAKEPRGRLSEDERDRLLAACRESGNRAMYAIVVVALQGATGCPSPRGVPVFTGYPFKAAP
jgi:hypothetical protein